MQRAERQASLVSRLAPQTVGIGLRQPHYKDIFEQRPALDFLEVHSENFFHSGGASLHVLEHAREFYPISLHGVGLSLASADAFAQPCGDTHLHKLAQLVAHIQPTLISEHLCWGAIGGKHFNDLLPFPYTVAALNLLAERIDHVQNTLGRKILVENLSAYLEFRNTDMDEFSFLAELSQRTGCSILLDVNNLYVNACNFDYDPWPLVQKLPAQAIGEIHLAGHTRTEDCLIDTHSDVVCDGVWQLYQRVLAQVGAVPTLIEWDTDIPPLETLLQQAEIARSHLFSMESNSLELIDLAPLPVHAKAQAESESNRIEKSLEQTQLQFGAAMLSPKNANAAASLFAQTEEIAVDRLAIYRGNVVSAITKALQAAYPVVEQIVGEEFFAALARACWQEYPSTSGDLHDYGQSFSGFVARFPHTREMPYLSDVATLEWAVHAAYGAADHVPLKMSALGEVAPEQVGHLRFAFQTGAALLRSDYPIASIWLQHQTGYPHAIDIDLTQAEAALVHRAGDKVCTTPLLAEQFHFLLQLQQGESLQAALLNTLEQHPQFAADQALALAFNAQLIIALRKEQHEQ